MQKSLKGPALRKERDRRFIRFDKHIQRLRLSSFLNDARDELGIPENGFHHIDDLLIWQEQTFSDRCLTDKWRNWMEKGLRLAKLPDWCLANIDQLVTLNSSGGYEVSQPGIPHRRTDKSYYRARKLWELSQAIDPETGKKLDPSGAAKTYDPENGKIGREWKTWEIYDWHDKFVVNGGQARKIISKWKKQILR